MAHVKAHYRKDAKTGKVVRVSDYDDHRGHRPKPAKHYISHPLKGADSMRDKITSLLNEPGVKEFEGTIKAGGFSQSLPEIGALFGLEQGGHHPYRDAFDHTLQVIRQLPENADANTRWAALLHDIGKAVTRKDHPDRGVVFDHHEAVGAKMAKKVMARLGFSREDSYEIRELIKYHGSLRTVMLRGERVEKEALVQRPYFHKLLSLHIADVRASGRDPKEVLESVGQTVDKLLLSQGVVAEPSS